MADRKPDLMQRKVDTKKVIDLSKMNVKKLTGLLKVFKGKKDRESVRKHIHFRHSMHNDKLAKYAHRKKRRARNAMARESRRINRG